MRRDTQRLNEELAALQRTWRLSEQAEELERAAAHDKVAVAEE
jgi:hypothetical protein